VGDLLISTFSFDAMDFFGDFGDTSFANFVVDFFGLGAAGFFLITGLAFLDSIGFFGLWAFTGETRLALDVGDRTILLAAKEKIGK